jgi:hypothetical protein
MMLIYSQSQLKCFDYRGYFQNGLLKWCGFMSQVNCILHLVEIEPKWFSGHALLFPESSDSDALWLIIVQRISYSITNMLLASNWSVESYWHTEGSSHIRRFCWLSFHSSNSSYRPILPFILFKQPLPFLAESILFTALTFHPFRDSCLGIWTSVPLKQHSPKSMHCWELFLLGVHMFSQCNQTPHAGNGNPLCPLCLTLNTHKALLMWVGEEGTSCT